MAKRQQVNVLNRLVGKKIVFNGKFYYDQESRLKQLAEAQQGKVLDDLDASTDYLVLADLSSGKTIQKKVLSLNAKGGAIQVLSREAFQQQFNPTADELLALIKLGQAAAPILAAAAPAASGHGHGVSADCPRMSDMNFDGLDLSQFCFGGIGFDRCSFRGTTLNGTHFAEAIECDFWNSVGDSPSFGKIDCSRFCGATFRHAQFCAHLAGSDFSNANFEECAFNQSFWASAVTPQPSDQGVKFTKARLIRCVFEGVWMEGADFEEADLTSTAFRGCHMDRSNLRKANASQALLVAADLKDSNLSQASFVGANLAEADLTNAQLNGTDFTAANLRGITVAENALKQAKGVTPQQMQVGSAGPVVTQLDGIFSKAKQTEFSFQVGDGADENGIELRFSVYPQKNTNFAYLHHSANGVIAPQPLGAVNFSAEIMQAARVFGHLPVRFETLTVKSTKSPTSGKELRELLIQGIAEAFGQDIPTIDDAATVAFRAKQRAAADAAREARQQAQEAAAKEKEQAKKQIAKQIKKAVGKVTDIATFLKALEVRIEKPKIDKATKMLKASGFKLFNDITGEQISGIVKSQSDPDLVYACRVDEHGHFACCTQNLNICGGLRGSLCKHLLVLIIGLVQAGELDPTTIDHWIAKTLDTKAELDKETMGTIFIKYKGAEAGEVDWRPTETVPEDYYAL